MLGKPFFGHNSETEVKYGITKYNSPIFAIYIQGCDDKWTSSREETFFFYLGRISSKWLQLKAQEQREKVADVWQQRCLISYHLLTPVQHNQQCN